MTEMTETAKNNFCVRAIDNKKDLEFGFLELGKMLYEIKTQRMFEAGWDSWEEYCMELKLSDATISKLFRIYEVFVLHYKIPQEALAEAGGWSNVSELLPLVDVETTPKARVRELLGIATNQTRSDLRKTIFEAKVGKSCGHKKKRYLVLEICDDGCNERWNVTDNYELKRK